MNNKILSILLLLALTAIAYLYFSKHNIINNGTNNIETPIKKENKSMEFINLPSGLKYKVLKAGTGTHTPNPGQTVKVKYAGYFADNGENLGRKFDSGEFEFKAGVGQVIKGFDEAVLSMVQGEERRVIIPSDLGYGSRGVPGTIPGNSTLIFDLEILNIK